MTTHLQTHSNILTATSDPSLIARLQQMLEHADRTDIAVGYLYLSGFHQVADQLEGLSKVRVLIGRTDRPTLEAIAAGLQQADAIRARAESDGLVKRSERERLATDAARSVGEGVSRLPQDDGSQRDVRRLRDLIAAGKLDIRTYPHGLLHAKAYICWYPDGGDALGSAVVGSSNFTLAGFRGNTELNVRLQNDSDVSALGRWFDALWEDSVDITGDVLVELRRSWPIVETPPYHIYLKTLYELYRDDLGLPKLEPTRRGVELANFQTDAVAHALGMIDRHGGCFIGDVVGLGKTYIGAEIVRQLQLAEPFDRHPLIVCPAGLKPMWERINEQFGLGAAVVSMSALRPASGARFDEESGEYVEEENGEGIDLAATYPNRGVVLVDEVHNFRNPATRRYRALYDYLWDGDHKVVLLSATPQNLGPQDIYNELRLFLDEVEHGLTIEPLGLREYFAAVQRWYAYQVELDNWRLEHERWRIQQQVSRKKVAPPEQPAQPDVPFADITNVLLPVFVRRRRKDIRELYGDDATLRGKPVRFPDPKLQNLNYRLDRVYEKAFDFDDLKGRLAKHSGARYRALDYLKPEARTKKDYSDLIRARTRVAALTQFLLVKRLESSVAAFRSTLEVIARSNRAFRAALSGGFVPIGETAATILAGAHVDTEDLLNRLQSEEEERERAGKKRSKMVHPTTDFDVDRWMHDLDSDYKALQGILDRLGQIAPDDDDKLQELKRFLARKDVRAGKVLIFSEAEATIDYLYEQLNPGEADPSIAKISGSNRKRLPEIVKRFAPKANLAPKEKMPGPEIGILLATDLVSEGQNLQDCNRVLNYDLHWNPVRLIQRFGRVDRIGTEHETIYLHNTWPDTRVDEQLDLTGRLIHRIQAFHDMIGLDTQLLSETERLNPQGMFAIYEERRLPEDQGDGLDAVSAHQRGINLLQQLERTNSGLWSLLTTLPDGIRSARVPPRPPRDLKAEGFDDKLRVGGIQIPMLSPEEEMGIRTPTDDPHPGETVVLFEQDGHRLAYAVDDDLEPRPITVSQLVKAVACEPETKAEPLPAGTNKRVMAAYDRARLDAAKRLGREGKPGDTKLRRYLRRELKKLRDTFRGNDEELRRIGILQQIFEAPLPPRATDALTDMYRLNLQDETLLLRLEALREHYRLALPGDGDSGGEPAGVLRIVCSEGLV